MISDRTAMRNISNDWMMVGGHCHYAKDLCWFSDDYRKFDKALHVDGENEVIGIGTVVLNARCSLKNNQCKTLVLRNVLHTPNSSCNGFEFKSHCDSFRTTEGKIFCADESKKQIFYGSVLTCLYPRLILAENVGFSYMHGAKNQFLDIFLKKKEMFELFGAKYPFYLQ